MSTIQPRRAAARPFISPLRAALAGALLVAAGCAEPGPDCAPAVCDRQHCDQVEIPAGELTMGSELAPDGDGMWWFEEFFDGIYDYGDERDPHPVSLGRFFIDKFEVTYQRYHDCVRAGCCDPGGTRWGDNDEAAEGDPVVVSNYPEHCYDPAVACPYHPVNCKSYAQAEQYCAWIGRRLCTEAEWERAAQGPGPEQREYPWGDAPPDVQRARLWIYGDEVGGETDLEPPVPVNEHPLGATDEGVYGMAGNVLEWVADWYGPYPDGGGAATDPTGPASGERRVARGGCFHTTYFEARNTARLTFDPAFDWG